MTIYVIGYDLHPSHGETYDELIQAIKNLGNWWHCLDSTWLVVSNLSSVEIRDRLRRHMKNDDQLIVVAYNPPNSAWVGFSGDCQDWLKKHM